MENVTYARVLYTLLLRLRAAFFFKAAQIVHLKSTLLASILTDKSINHLDSNASRETDEAYSRIDCGPVLSGPLKSIFYAELGIPSLAPSD